VDTSDGEDKQADEEAVPRTFEIAFDGLAIIKRPYRYLNKNNTTVKNIMV
jgi:hypothetical protein